MFFRKFFIVAIFIFFIFCSFSSTSFAVMYTYDGSHDLTNNGGGTFTIKLKTGGTFVPANNMTTTVFLVGGGGAGASRGGHGGGGYTSTTTNVALTKNQSYTISVGSGGDTSAETGGTTSAFSLSVAGGGGGVPGTITGQTCVVYGTSGTAGNVYYYSSLKAAASSIGSGYKTVNLKYPITWATHNNGTSLIKAYSTGYYRCNISSYGAYIGTAGSNGAGGTETYAFGEASGDQLYSGVGTTLVAGGTNTGKGGGGSNNYNTTSFANGGSGIVILRFTDTTVPTCGTWSPTSSPWKTSGTQTFTLSGSTDTGGSGISTSGGSCTTSSTNGSTCTVTISDVAGNTTTCTSPVNNVDTTAPSGGSISYSATTITSSTQSLSITVADGTDSLAGINTSTRQLLRQEAVLTDGTCGSYGTATSVSYLGTYPNITTTNFEPNHCYKYQWSVSDNAGNNAIYSSSTVVTTSPDLISIKNIAIGSFISINNFNFIKVSSSGLFIAYSSAN